MHCWDSKLAFLDHESNNIIPKTTADNVTIWLSEMLIGQPQCLPCSWVAALPWDYAAESCQTRHRTRSRWSWRCGPNDVAASPCWPSTRAAGRSRWSRRSSYAGLRRPAILWEPSVAYDIYQLHNRTKILNPVGIGRPDAILWLRQSDKCLFLYT